MSDLYDPQATEEEASSKSQYIGKKDIFILFGIVLVLGILLYPIYRMGQKNSEKVRCAANFKSMFEAINLYAKDHDDGLPPLFVVGAEGLPARDSKGRPYTWASDIAGYMNSRASFVCPSSLPEEAVTVQSPKAGESFATTYGMYAPYGGVKTFNVENSDTTILLAETSTEGSNGSFDPLKFEFDGIVIGWDDDNVQSTEKSAYVTRLAFKGSQDGDFKDAIGRHDGKNKTSSYAGSHALTAAGELILLRAGDAKVQKRADNLPGGYWNVPSLRK